jgi:hypothetical protein
VALTGNFPPRNMTASANDSPRANRAITLSRPSPERPDPAVEDDVELARRLALDEQHRVVRKAPDRGLGEQVGQPAGSALGERWGRREVRSGLIGTPRRRTSSDCEIADPDLICR